MKVVLTQVIAYYLCQMPKLAAPTDSQILGRLLSHGRGCVYTPASLADLGTWNFPSCFPLEPVSGFLDGHEVLHIQ
jgi:hypothetical protein